MSQKRTVLLIAPRGNRRDGFRHALTEAGFAVETALPDVRVSDVLAERTAPQLTIIDGVDIGEASWSLLDHLVERPTIMLLPHPKDLIRCLEAGAEDCIADDVDTDEIVARAEAVLRRSAAGPTPEPTVIYVDHRLWINYTTRQVWVHGEAAKLTPREYRLLRHLVDHVNVTLSHDDILASVWGREPSGDRPNEVLKQYIWRLRQKIEANPDEPDIVITVPGAGYRFVGVK